MAEFKVNIEGIQDQTALLMKARMMMDEVASRLGSIEISRSISMAATLAMRLRLLDVQRAAQNHEQNLLEMARGLIQIADLYAHVERNVTANATGGGTGGTSGTQTPTDPTEGMTYDEILEYRAENAVDENTARLYERYQNKVKIADDSYDGTAHYNGSSNKIKYNAQEDASNVRGPGCTYYHEVGHLIDDQSDWNSYTSTDHSYNFYDCLKNDVDAWIRNCMEQNGYTDIDDAYEALSDWLCEDPNMKNGVSDLVKGLTNGEARGNWGHSDDYYNEGSIAREAFAHFFEAGMSHDPTKLEYIRQMFPSAYEEYQRMIRDELGD